MSRPVVRNSLYNWYQIRYNWLECLVAWVIQSGILFVLTFRKKVLPPSDWLYFIRGLLNWLYFTRGILNWLYFTRGLLNWLYFTRGILNSLYFTREILNYSPDPNSVTLKTATARLPEMSGQSDHKQSNEIEISFDHTRRKAYSIVMCILYLFFNLYIKCAYEMYT
jgi:hypothetical protein